MDRYGPETREAVEKLEAIRRRVATERVQDAVRLNAGGIIAREVDDEDFAWYQKSEERHVERFANLISETLSEKVIPAIRAYLAYRFPERQVPEESEFAEGAWGLESNLSARVRYSRT
jgi:hypothetical protein